MILSRFFLDGFPAYQPYNIERNSDKLKKPFPNSSFAGGFVFSFGHFLLNVGYEENLDYVFIWEETY